MTVKYAKTPPQKYIDQAADQAEWLALAVPSVTLRRVLTEDSVGAVRCPDCWDDAMQSTNDPRCATCYGTGWTGGYEAQESVQLAVQDADTVKQWAWTPMGYVKTETSQTGWCPPSVNVKPRDLIVDGDGNRYLIAEAITNVLLYGTLVRQFFTLEQREVDDIIYSVPIT